MTVTESLVGVTYHVVASSELMRAAAFARDAIDAAADALVAATDADAEAADRHLEDARVAAGLLREAVRRHASGDAAADPAWQQLVEAADASVGAATKAKRRLAEKTDASAKKQLSDDAAALKAARGASEEALKALGNALDATDASSEVHSRLETARKAIATIAEPAMASGDRDSTWRRRLRKLRDWCFPTVATEESSHLEGLTKWAAGGFTAAAAVLAFFGVKDGLLNRLVSAFPAQVIVIAGMLTLGIVGAAAAPLVRTGRGTRLGLVGAFVAVLVAASAKWIFPRVGSTVETRQAVVVGTISVVAVVCALTVAIRISAMAATLLLSVGLTLSGLYGALDMGVVGKRFSPGVQVVPTLERDASTGVSTVAVRVTAAGLRDRGALRLYLVADQSETPFAMAVLAPDVDGVLDRTNAFTVPPTAQDVSLRITRCIDAASRSSATEPVDSRVECAAEDATAAVEYARVRVTPVAAPARNLAASIVPTATAGTVHVVVMGAGLTSGTAVAVDVSGTRGTLVQAAVLADGTGRAQWESDVAIGNAAVVSVTAKATDAGEVVSALARYSVTNR